MKSYSYTSKTDKELARLVEKEERRQESTLDLIPSENIASLPIRELVGSVLMNKYSEGYPGKRYYPGNSHIDEIERLAQKRALSAFRLNGDWHVNVQPYSGSPANLAVMLGLIKMGDTILGMELSAGGHLTHGHKVSASGILFKSYSYGVDSKTGRIDFDQVLRLAKNHKPKLIISGLTAYPRAIDFKKFGAIAKKVGAYHLADISHIAGLVAAGLHQSPFPYADVVTTTTHKILQGPRGAVIFSRRARARRSLAEANSEGGLPFISDLIDRAVFPGLQGGPHDNTTAAIAFMFSQVGTPTYRKYAKGVLENARELAKVLMKEGFKLATNGTDNHLIMLDLKPLGLTGQEAERKLERAGIIANRNSLPQDVSPFRPSGIRLGTPAITTRGLKAKDMVRIGAWISHILIGGENPKKVSIEVKKFLKRFPIK